MNIVICALILCGLTYGDVSHLKHNEDNNGYLPPERGSSISSVPWHSNLLNEANFQPEPGQVVNYKGMTIQRSNEIHFGSFADNHQQGSPTHTLAVPKVNKAYENPNEDLPIPESFKGDGYLPPQAEVIPEPQHPNPVIPPQKIRMPMPSWFGNEILRNQAASKQGVPSTGHSSSLNSLPESNSKFVGSTSHELSLTSNEHPVPESFKGDGYLPPSSDQSVAITHDQPAVPPKKFDIPLPSWMKHAITSNQVVDSGNSFGSSSGNTFGSSIKSKPLPTSNIRKQNVVPLTSNIVVPPSKSTVFNTQPHVTQEYIPPKSVQQKVVPAKLPPKATVNIRPSISTSSAYVPPSSNGIHKSHHQQATTTTFQKPKKPTLSNAIHESHHQEVLPTAHNQPTVNLKPAQPFDEIESHENGYNYGKKISIPFEEGSKPSVQDQFRTLQIYSKNSKKVNTFKVLEKAEQNGLKTIKILGKTNKAPSQENFLRTVQIVGAKNDEPLQTVKIFDDSHGDNKGYLPPKSHYFK